MQIWLSSHRLSNEEVQFALAVSPDSNLELFSVALSSVASSYKQEAQPDDLGRPADFLFDPRISSFAKLLESTVGDKQEEQLVRSLTVRLSASVAVDRPAALQVV